MESVNHVAGNGNLTEELLDAIKANTEAVREANSSDQLNVTLERQTNEIKGLGQKLDQLSRELIATRKNLAVVRLQVANDTLDDVSGFVRGRQLSFEDTMSRLVDGTASFSRFGDGELQMMMSPTYNLGFQRNNEYIRRNLRSVFTAEVKSNLLIGFPQVFRDVHGAQVWSQIWSELKRLVPPGLMYGNSHVSRPFYFSYAGEKGAQAWRSVWDGKTVCVITGKGSRFDLIPELFSNVKDSEFLLSLPRDADRDLDRLLEAANGMEPDLFLISLGPAGTVLSARLAAAGKRAIDIGHISNSYMNVFSKATTPERLPAEK